MKAIINIFLFSGFVFGCSQAKTNETKAELPPETIVSFETNYRFDTINRIDKAGRKQGMWIKSIMHPKEPKDTVYYKDGEVIK